MFKSKYLKYKNKYLQLKNQYGSSAHSENTITFKIERTIMENPKNSKKIIELLKLENVPGIRIENSEKYIFLIIPNNEFYRSTFNTIHELLTTFKIFVDRGDRIVEIFNRELIPIINKSTSKLKFIISARDEIIVPPAIERPSEFASIDTLETTISKYILISAHGTSPGVDFVIPDNTYIITISSVGNNLPIVIDMDIMLKSLLTSIDSNPLFENHNKSKIKTTRGKEIERALQFYDSSLELKNHFPGSKMNDMLLDFKQKPCDTPFDGKKLCGLQIYDSNKKSLEVINPDELLVELSSGIRKKDGSPRLLPDLTSKPRSIDLDSNQLFLETIVKKYAPGIFIVRACRVFSPDVSLQKQQLQRENSI